MVLNFAGTHQEIQFDNYQEVPTEANKIINADKAQIPNMRFNFADV